MRGYKVDLVSPAQPTSSHMISLYSSTSFPMAEKKKRKNRSKGKHEGVISACREAVLLSFRFHGGAGLACAGGPVRAPAKSCKSGVYDCGRTSYLSCSCRSCVPRSGSGICCGVLSVLRVRIWCTPTSIPPLIAAVQWLRTASSESFGDPTYRGLRNLV
jgi:hypothetical protein